MNDTDTGNKNFYRIYVIMWPAYSGHKYKKYIRFFQTCCFGWHFGRIIIRHALWHLFSHIVEPLRSWNTALSVCPWQEWYKIWEKTVISRFQQCCTVCLKDLNDFLKLKINVSFLLKKTFQMWILAFCHCAIFLILEQCNWE